MEFCKGQVETAQEACRICAGIECEGYWTVYYYGHPYHKYFHKFIEIYGILSECLNFEIINVWEAAFPITDKYTIP
jgi:hypothetical protein